jgi:formate hydrogenlyase transcriptional activator
MSRPQELQSVHLVESRARLILDLAKAVNAHLDLGDVLESLIVGLKPRVHFQAIGVAVLEGDYTRVHSVHVEGVHRIRGESIESVMSRVQSVLRVGGDLHGRKKVADSHVSLFLSSHKPYVCPNLEAEKRFAQDEEFLKAGFASYISLPLLQQGELIGAVTLASFHRQDFSDDDVALLQDASDIISIAVSNALAFEEIRTLRDQLQAENRALQDEIVQKSIFEEIVGSSAALRSALSAIDRVAPTDSTVLITGETGTGKELVAHAIHRRSTRSGRALVKVNCAALPGELIASELFGHEKGAFTGALNQRIGRFEAANGGTIFLDEIGELSPEMQISLLRVLQEREFERVGGNRTIRTDVRVIAATNRDLAREVEVNRFRMDLYYRLNVFPVRVPALRERMDDIPILVDYFVAHFARRMGKKIGQIEKRTLDALLAYSWPGNIRELQNLIERGVILADGDVFRLESALLPQPSRTTAPLSTAPTASRDDQRSIIEALLRETHGRISGPDGAAAKLGIPASTLESRIRALGINKHLFRGNGPERARE